MPNVMGVLRAEIRRLARKETKQELGDLKKQLTVLRRRLAEWNRRMQGVVGVSAQTIMGWEAGRTRPRRAALRNWRAIRGKGVRELRAMLGGGEGVGTRAGRSANGRRRKVRKAVRKAGRRLRARARARATRVARTVRRGRAVVASRAAHSSRARRTRAAKRK